MTPPEPRPITPLPSDVFEVVDEAPAARRRRLPVWVRGGLVLAACGLIGVFTVAARLDPYHPDGTPRTMETHRQLGLEPCSFKVMTGYPCPSCGMTTSFAHLMHGDVANSLRANWVGTLLAVAWMLAVPWSLLSAWKGRPVWVRDLEMSLLIVVAGLVTLMLARWAVVLVWAARG